MSAPSGTADVLVGDRPSVGEGNHSYVSSVSPGMRGVERLLADIAPTDIPVLLVGESGTGKDILALHLHRGSRRKQEPFVKMSCAGLTAETLQSFLNGTDKGNGSNGSSLHPGTLFLDEICDLDLSCQPRLLSSLPDGASSSVEGAGAMLEARLICATSHNLDEQLRTGRFREELYFRINGVCLRIPPLRHRREDIPLLLEFFVEKYAAEMGRRKPSVSSRTVQAAIEHPWPGNVRELENFARMIVLLGDERAAAVELESANGSHTAQKENGGAISLKEASRAASRQAERELILKTLARTRWNRKRAAQELQISYKALLYKLKDIGLDDSQH